MGCKAAGVGSGAVGAVVELVAAVAALAVAVAALGAALALVELLAPRAIAFALPGAACGFASGLSRTDNPAKDARPVRLSAPFVALGSDTPIKIIAAMCNSADAKKNNLVALLMGLLRG